MVNEVGVSFQQWSVTDSQARKEDRVRSLASGRAMLGQGEPAIHLRCPRIRRWWIPKRPANEGSRGGIVKGPRGVAAWVAVSASSSPGIPLCLGIHRRDLRWWVTGDRRSIALMRDWLSVQIVSVYSGWLVVDHSNAYQLFLVRRGGDSGVGWKGQAGRPFHDYSCATILGSR